MPKLPLAVAVLVAALARSTTAHATEPPMVPRDPAAAEVAFEQGLALMRAGENAAACPKLEQSHRLDPGVGVLMYLGECYERVGRFASAWAAFREAAAGAKQAAQAEREQTANERARALEGRLPKLQITVPPQSRVPGLEIVRDDIVVGPSLWDSAVPVDPGAHAIVARAPGRQPHTQDVTSVEGRLDTVSIPQLQSTPVEPPPSAAPPIVPLIAPRLREPQHDPWSGARIAGVTIGSVGLVGVAIGGGFGIATFTTWGSAADHCDGAGEPRACDPEGIRLGENAQVYGAASTVLFAVGGALTAGGLVLALAAPDAAPVEVHALPTGFRVTAPF